MNTVWLWIAIVLVELLLMGGLVFAFRKLLWLEEQFESWRVEATPAIQKYRLQMRDLRHQLEKWDADTDELAHIGGWRGQLARFVIDQIII